MWSDVKLRASPFEKGGWRGIYITRFFQSAPILISLSILFIIFEYQAPVVFLKYLGSAFDATKITTLIFLIAYTVLCFFVMPVVTSKIIFRENIKKLGLIVPENKKTALFLIIVALLLLAPCMVLFAQQKQFQHYYSLGHPSVSKFIFIQFMMLPIYYFIEEFFFRGFLFLTLWRKIGWHSFWITDVIFTCAHFGKPLPEILLAIPAGIILNYLTLRTQSIYPAAWVHAVLGILLNCLVNY
jgi:membrane protease YdiL (CAAX protease family)